MKNEEEQPVPELPRMLFADDQGRIYDHPDYLMVGRSADRIVHRIGSDRIVLPEMSRLFYLPKCRPVGLDPKTGRTVTLKHTKLGRRTTQCWAVAAFLEPGYVRTLLPATESAGKDYVLPLWAYSAVGFLDGQYVAEAFRVEDNPHWDPRNFDDREMMPKLEARMHRNGDNPLFQHLAHCATHNHCFAAKNLFLQRWEAPLPVSRTCNARCLGCLSEQPDGSCPAAHARIDFRPTVKQIVDVAVPHLENAPDPIVSFGQGCEGEPLTEAPLIEEAIVEIRRQTKKGTVNLNTNGSLPRAVERLVDAGLDSIRVSMNSARPEIYRAYVRPNGFDITDIERTLRLCGDAGLFTMVNYLVFPGVTDEEEEWDALKGLIERTGLRFVHFKNLCIDPDVYLEAIPGPRSDGMGLKVLADRIRDAFPEVRIGYFNQPKTTEGMPRKSRNNSKRNSF